MSTWIIVTVAFLLGSSLGFAVAWSMARSRMASTFEPPHSQSLRHLL